MFHSFGTIQSKTLVPDLISIIFNFPNSFYIYFKVFLLPIPVILLCIGNKLTAQEYIFSFVIFILIP